MDILGKSYMLISSGSYIIIISQSSLWFVFHPHPHYHQPDLSTMGQCTRYACNWTVS